MRITFRSLLLMAMWGVGLWFFFAIFTPFLEGHIPAWKRYNQIQEEQNLDSGALYYTNVPQTQEAEEATRRAVKEGMAERRKQKQAGINGGN